VRGWPRPRRDTPESWQGSLVSFRYVLDRRPPISPVLTHFTARRDQDPLPNGYRSGSLSQPWCAAILGSAAYCDGTPAGASIRTADFHLGPQRVRHAADSELFGAQHRYRDPSFFVAGCPATTLADRSIGRSY
jgi:hypothetical protein